MNEFKWKKEVTYVLEYEGATYEEHHYVNGIDGIRYRSSEGQLSYSPSVTTFKSTGREFETINCELVGEQLISQDEYIKSVDLLFHLPDVDKHLKVNYKAETGYGAFFDFTSVLY